MCQPRIKRHTFKVLLNISYDNSEWMGATGPHPKHNSHSGSSSSCCLRLAVFLKHCWHRMSKSASSSSGKHLSSIHCKQNQRLHRRQGYRDLNPSQELVHTRARQSSHGHGNLGSASGSYFAHPLGTIGRNGNRPLCQGCYIRNQLLRAVAPTSCRIATETCTHTNKIQWRLA